MTTEKKHPINAEDISNYLLNNKDFFDNKSSLLGELSLFQNNGAIISLAEKQVSLLKKENAKLILQLNAFIKIAGENEALTIKINQLIFALLKAKNPQDIFSILYNQLCKSFQADRVAIRIFANAKKESSYSGIEFFGKENKKIKLFDTILKNNQATCMKMTTEQHNFLFSNGTNNSASSVMIPLQNDTWKGIMAIGSLDPKRFQKDMQFDVLMHMVAVLNFMLNPWIANI